MVHFKLLGNTGYQIRKRFFKISHQRKNPGRADAKWELILSHLPEKPGSLLDIGCNEGMFTINAAKIGWCAWGFDLHNNAVDFAARTVRKKRISGAFISFGALTPEIAKKLPKFDVIIIVSTFQEICTAYGMEKGYEVFQCLLNSCNGMLFFEPSSVNSKFGHDVKIFDINNDIKSIEKWVKSLVAGSQSWSVRYVGRTVYTKKEPYRYMFLFEKNV